MTPSCKASPDPCGPFIGRTEQIPHAHCPTSPRAIVPSPRAGCDTDSLESICPLGSGPVSADGPASTYASAKLSRASQGPRRTEVPCPHEKPRLHAWERPKGWLEETLAVRCRQPPGGLRDPHAACSVRSAAVPHRDAARLCVPCPISGAVSQKLRSLLRLPGNLAGLGKHPLFLT